MGKRILAQRKGKGPIFKAKSFRYRSRAKHLNHSSRTIKATIMDFVHCPGHSAPLAKIRSKDNMISFILAPEGLKVGDVINYGDDLGANPGNVASIGTLPEGTIVHNIELRPGDGGRIVRGSGTFARIQSKIPEGVVIQLPSKKKKIFQSRCRAAIGVVAGGGRKEKPFVKAGRRYHALKARGKSYPKVRGLAMNALCHPFGGTSSHTKGKPTQAARNAPPGRKVGKIAPKRTGRKKK